MQENWVNYYPYWDNAGGGSTSRTTSNVQVGSYRMFAMAGVAKGTSITCSIVADGVTVAITTFTYPGNENSVFRYINFLLPNGVASVQMVINKSGTYGSSGIAIEKDTNYLTAKGHVNINDVWKVVEGQWVNINGVWKAVTGQWVNINGVWKAQI